jgi:hypothetical protein
MKDKDSKMPGNVPRMLGWAILGVALLAVGSILLFVPLIPQSTTGVSGIQPTVVNVAAPFSLTGLVALDVTWSSPGPVKFVAVSCASFSTSDAGLNATCPGLSVIAVQNASSGHLDFSVPIGSAVILGILGSPNDSAQVTVKTTSPVLGTAFVVAGIAELVAVLLVRIRSRPKPNVVHLVPVDTTVPGEPSEIMRGPADSPAPAKE